MFLDLLERCFFKASHHFTCPICTESLPVEKRFRNKNCSLFSSCYRRYCTDCIARYVKVAVEDNRSPKVKCPSPECKSLLDPLSCRPLLSLGTFARWCDVLCEDLVLRLTSSYCPYRKCSEPVLSECSDFITWAKCPKCKREFCFRCKVRWHAGFHCGGQQIDKDHLLFNNLARERGWRRCPKCRTCVERVDGCKAMACRCGTLFCYKCGVTRWVLFHECLSARIQEFTECNLTE